MSLVEALQEAVADAYRRGYQEAGREAGKAIDQAELLLRQRRKELEEDRRVLLYIAAARDLKTIQRLAGERAGELSGL